MRRCPNCKNKKENYIILKCTRCKGTWCYTGNMFTNDGCGNLNSCVHCGNTDGIFNHGWDQIGEIGVDDDDDDE